MNPRRVLHVLDTAGPYGAATCKIVENLATGIDPSRYQVQVCFLERGPLEDNFSRAGIGFSCVDWKGGAGDLPGAMRYASLLRSSEFNIIHQHTGGRLLTGMGRRLTHARIVRTLHSRVDERTGTVASHCDLPPRDALITVSRAVADFSGDPHAVVIYPGVDISRFHQPRIAHNGFVIGTACRLEAVKGLEYLLEAMAQLTQECNDVQLEIAGDGGLRSTLEEESQRLAVSGHVSFLGWREDLPSVMAGWDAFVMPSLDEGFPIAALDAMAAGLPVVASAVGGLRELVEDGVTGYLVPAAAPAELAARLLDLVSNRQKREAMGTEGLRRALREYSVARMVERTVAVYDELLAE